MKKIGQVTMSVKSISGQPDKMEATFTWVQASRGFETLIGKSVNYDRNQPFGHVRKGIKGIEKQAIVFENSKRQPVANGEFSALISWGGESSEFWPDFLCIASKSDFDAAAKAVVEEKKVWVDPAQGREKPKPQKPTPPKRVVQASNIIDIDAERGKSQKTFKVIALGNEFIGSTLYDIVNEATKTMDGVDPRPTLLAGSWFEKGLMSGVYIKTDTPTSLPAPTPFLLKKQAGEKKGG